MNDDAQQPTPSDTPLPATPGPNAPPVVADLGAPYEPAVMRWRHALPKWVKRTAVPEGSRRRRWWWERLFVPIDTTNEYANEDEVLAALRATQSDRSAAVLGEAEEIFRRPFETSEGVERRASTLQGSIAIAASFVLAGGGLLLGTSKISGEGWRVAFAAVFALVILSLVASALRSLRATSRVLVWHYPDESDLLLRRQRADASEHELADRGRPPERRAART